MDVVRIFNYDLLRKEIKKHPMYPYQQQLSSEIQIIQD